MRDEIDVRDCKGQRPLQSPQWRAALDGHCETAFRENKSYVV